MQAGALSSVYRGTKNARLAVEYVIGSLGPVRMTGGMVVYTGDCLPAIQDLLRMKGSADVFRSNGCIHLQLVMMCMWIDFTWQPRTHEWLRYAGELSRIQDSSEIFLRHNQFVFVCKLKHQGRVWGWPTLDVLGTVYILGQQCYDRFC